MITSPVLPGNTWSKPWPELAMVATDRGWQVTFGDLQLLVHWPDQLDALSGALSIITGDNVAITRYKGHYLVCVGRKELGVLPDAAPIAELAASTLDAIVAWRSGC